MMSRRSAIIVRAAQTGVCALALAGVACTATEGELLYNGIRLDKVWPPRNDTSASREVRPVPYLQQRPAVVPIDLGRQLLVDDFLIERTDLQRVFHQPRKFEGNPVLKPETALELNGGICPTAAPFSDGVFYDPKDQLYKMWYMAGWMGRVALATSKDGLKWQRPDFGVVEHTNQVVAREGLRDGASVWLDHDAANLQERYKMFIYDRAALIGGTGRGNLLTSPDGVNWSWRGQTGKTRDNTTMFYNPFRKVWVFSHRTRSANKEQWRVRGYWENRNFLAGLDDWDDYEPVFWVGPDKLDRPHPEIGHATQIYKVDAVGYESLMLGLVQVHYGPPNEVVARLGVPKLTELTVAFSRDGFHWDRPERTSFIGATMRRGSWERAYVSSAGGVCLVVGDQLYFYYTAFEGDETRTRTTPDGTTGKNLHERWTGMYAKASTGLAILRRDGFASMEAPQQEGSLVTRPVRFQGKHLFVNVACPQGALRVEVLDENEKPIAPFALGNCETIAVDSTIHAVRWRGGDDLSALAGRNVRFRFTLRNGSLFSFWVSPERSGASHGFVAAGGPGFRGATDDTGRAAYGRQ
ncbi:MAG: glycosyl hydrolase family 32 [Opitutus sp.]|nr:glycosyl hydrolase family 32 [Opitutus sp.]